MVKFTYHQAGPLEIDAHEVLREVGKLPHLLLRIGVRGSHFPQRALEPFARVIGGGDSKPIEAHLVDIDNDERGLRAYFATDLPLRGTLIVGYGSEITAEIPLEALALRAEELDERRITTKFHRVTLLNLGEFRRRD